MDKKDSVQLRIGSIVQLAPHVANPMFAYNFLVVKEVKDWGIMGYVQPLGEGGQKPEGQAYYRAKWDEVEPTGGEAIWVVE